MVLSLVSVQSCPIWMETWQIHLTFSFFIGKFLGKWATSDLLFAEAFAIVFRGRLESALSTHKGCKLRGLFPGPASHVLLPFYLAVLAWDENPGKTFTKLGRPLQKEDTYFCLQRMPIQRGSHWRWVPCFAHPFSQWSFHVRFSLHFNTLPFLFWRKDICWQNKMRREWDVERISYKSNHEDGTAIATMLYVEELFLKHFTTKGSVVSSSENNSVFLYR